MTAGKNMDHDSHLRHSDSSLKVWRLEKQGVLVAGFSDVAISVDPQY